MSKVFLYLIAAIGIGLIAVVAYIAIDVWSVGWITHDGTITITIPENQQ